MYSDLKNKKTINYRGILNFEIPKDWVEEYDDEDGAAFYKDHPDSGTLRMKVISIEVPQNKNITNAKDVLTDLTFNKESKIIELPNENVYNMFYEQTTDEGFDITIYYWSLVQAIQFDKTRLINLSYTILTKELSKKHINQEIDFITQSVENLTLKPL